MNKNNFGLDCGCEIFERIKRSNFTYNLFNFRI